MRKASPSKPSPAALRDAFLADLPAAWAYFLDRHPEETPYAFVLYGGADPVELTAHVLTEEGLTRVATRYVEGGYYDTVDEARAALRYSVSDSPWFEELRGRLPTLDALWGPHLNAFDETTGYRLLGGAAVDALKRLDGRRLFGAGKQRGQLMLAVINGEADEDWTERSVKRLNPAAVYRRFEAETKIEGVYASCSTLAASPDGRSVYSTGNRDLDPDGDDDVNELVAYDLRRRMLKRRWAFTFPTWGDSGRALAAAPDGRSVVMMRCRYIEKTAHVVLMRFAKNRATPTAEHTFPGEPSSFAASPDGTRFVVGLNDKTLHVFDAEFRLLRTHAVPLRPGGMCFVNPRVLLVATDKGVMRVQLGGTGKATFVVEGAALRLHADDARRLVAVSTWIGTKSKKEIPVRLLRLPSLKPVRTFVVPGHHAFAGTLSPDGRLLAAEAHEIGKARKTLVVFETTTGREIARRKSDYVPDLTFLRDNRTLAIPTSGFTTAEPIQLWAVR